MSSGRAFVVSNMLGQKAGCYLATSLLCQELARLGLRVTCFAQNVDFGGEGIPGTFYLVRPWVRRGCRWDWPGRCLAWQARRQIRSREPDYVIVMGTGPLARYLLSSSVASRLLIWELTNATPGNKFVDSEASRLLNRCRAMLSPSAAIDRGIRETYGYNGPILRLPFWIEDGPGGVQRSEGARLRDDGTTGPLEGNRGQRAADRGQRLGEGGLRDYGPRDCGPRDDGFRADFIYLGRRDVEKGLRELVRATAEVSKQFPGVRVLIAGQGSEEPFARLARDLQVEKNITFRFFPTRAETMAALAQSRCLVLPSYHEGYPLVLLEAAQSSVPFIATHVGSVPELFAGADGCEIIPPRDERALAGAMLRVIQETPEAYAAKRATVHSLFHRLSSQGAVEAALRRVLNDLNDE